MDIGPLREDRRRDRQLGRDVPLQRRLEHVRPHLVDAGPIDHARRGMIDKSAVLGGFETDAQSQLVGDERDVDHALGDIVQAAVLGPRNLAPGRFLGGVQVDRVADEPDRAAHGTGAPERPLRAAKDFALRQIEEERLGLPRVERVVADRDRRIVQINGHRRGSGGGADPPDLEIAQAGRAPAREREAWDGARQVGVGVHMLPFELHAGQHRNALGHLAQVLGSLLRRDDDFGDPRSGMWILLLRSRLGR